MKRIKQLIFTAGLVCSVVMIIFTACTKEGPQGPAGPAGKDGTNGTNGKDANATCTQCHNWSDSLVTKIFQYDASRHSLGETTFEGTRTSCAPCHTSQGFVECASTGSDTTAAPVYDAAQINCRTCHKIHKTYTNNDWELIVTSGFNPRYDKTVTIDLAADGGGSNLCARCHQPRTTSPWLTNPSSTTDSLKPTSSRWGPHYGAAGVVFAAKGAFEIGTSAFRSTNHKDALSCATCHQAQAQGALVGGHSLWMSNEEEGIKNNVSCKSAGCHSSLGNNTFDVNGKETEIAGMIQTLKVKLAVAGMLDTNTNYLKTGKWYKQKQLAVFWNYKLAYYDKSNGIHNYLYTYDMLQSGIDYMASLGY